MNENEKRKQELQEAIARWENEINTVWKDKNTQAAQDEVRNLRNLIANARREIDTIDGNVQQSNTVDDRNPEDVLKSLKTEKERSDAEKGRLKLSIERLKEERQDYTNNKDLYDEYTKKIEEVENELANLEMSQTEKYKRITTLKINIEGLKEKRENSKENKEAYDKYTETIKKLEKEYDELIKKEEEKEKNIKILTKGRMQEEADKKEIENEIKKKELEIAEIEYDTENAMEEIELSSGEKVKQPKVLRLYKELDELKSQLKGKEDKIKEYQDAIDELKGVKKEQKIEDHEITPDEIRYFHGQGDLREYGGENGEDTRKNRLDNDQYFAKNQTQSEIPTTTNETIEQEENKGQGQEENEDQGQKTEYEDLKFDGAEGLDMDDDQNKDIFSYSKDTVKNIKIDASTGKAYVTSSRGGKSEISIEDAMKTRKQLFKDLGVNDILKENGAKSFIDRLSIKRRINPVILSAIQSDPEMVNRYIESVMYGEDEMPFGYEADLNNPDLSLKSYRSLTRIGRKEKENGANIKGVSQTKGIRGLIDRIKNRQLPEPEIEEEIRKPSTRERKKEFVQKINESSKQNETIYSQDNVSKEASKDNDQDLEI